MRLLILIILFALAMMLCISCGTEKEIECQVQYGVYKGWALKERVGGNGYWLFYEVRGVKCRVAAYDTIGHQVDVLEKFLIPR